MNAVGIDVSKGKSTVAVLRHFDEVTAEPFDVLHNDIELGKLIDFIKSLPGQTKVVMEYTGTYFEPIANALRSAGIFVSVVNAILVHRYCGESIRRCKTDKRDALTLARYALDKWLRLPEYTPEEEIRRTLKILNKQYVQYTKMQTMQKNNLIALLDSVFPGINILFSSPQRKSDGHEKWVDFVLEFYHADCISNLSPEQFDLRYRDWCKSNSYNYSSRKSEEIYKFAKEQSCSLPMCGSVKLLITGSASQLISILETLDAVRKEMDRLSSQLPEYSVVMGLYGVGSVLGSQLIADIGNTKRFHSSKAVTAFAGLDAPPCQSGTLNVRSRSISKRGSPTLRKTLFQIINVIIQKKPENDPVYQFLDKKRSEGKPYKVYMMAAANKFLRIYYARVSEALSA